MRAEAVWIASCYNYGLIANTGRRENLVRVRELLNVAPVISAESSVDESSAESAKPTFICPDCGVAMIIVDILARKPQIRAPPRRRGELCVSS